MTDADLPGDDTDDTDETSEPDDSEESDDDEPQVSGLSWGRVAVLGAALAFLGLAVGLFVTRDQPPGSDSVDVGFYQDMIVHHDQALEMATMALANSEDPTIRGFAQDVLIFQARQIGLMDQKLNDWGTRREDRSDTAMAWMGMPVPVDQMPGLATPEQMDQLRNAKGREADALFLELMAAHHVGGIHMSEVAAADADDPDVRHLAEVLAYNQAVEVNEYSQIAERFGLPIEIAKVRVPEEPSS